MDKGHAWNKEMRVWIVLALLTVIWAASLAGVYILTRGKWYDLGVASGEIQGKRQNLDSLCDLAAPGGIDAQADVQLGVKATSVTLGQRGDLVDIRCAR